MLDVKGNIIYFRMKRILFIVLLCLTITLKIDAQNPLRSNLRANSLEIGFVCSSIKQDLMPNLKNYYGLNLAINRYFPFNKYLINDIFSWGLNVVWLDAELSQYKLRYYLNYWEGITDFERADLGIAFGPSIKIGSSEKFNGHIYANYSPSYVLLHQMGTWSSCFESKIIVGGAISYKWISFGVKYKLGVGLLNEIEVLEKSDNKISSKFKSIIYYLSFNF